MTDQITIVIPCKNEGFGIIKVLELIKNQSLECKIVVADSSTNNSKNILEQYKKNTNQIMEITGGGLPSVARNKGALLVNTPYILFLDADIYLYDKKIIKECLDEIRSRDFDLLTCKFRTIGGNYNWIYRVFDAIQWISSKTKPFAIGGFMLFKTETFKKLGGFYEEDKIAEDYHLSSKIKPKKFRIFNRYVYTTDRRFSKKGVYYMIKLAWKSWLNRNNEDFFKKDYDYWS